ncbi:MAG: alpha/beta hydrolase [Actinomycetota bacterium]|nr:alpha/beta hydrolase [Actinomycetota bacterium]
MRLVFIHGAFSRDGACWWAPTAALLEGSGVTSTAVALPSCGEAGIAPSAAGPGLDEDAAATTAVLDQGGPAVLIAHSYGGMVASQAGAHPAVQHLVYISSFLPAIGESLAALSSGATNPVTVTPHADGSVSVNHDDTAAFDSRFLHDVEDSKLVRGAHDRLCAQSSVVFGAETSTAAWQRVPSTYVVCAADRSTNPDLQRVHATRATTTRELPAGHFPMLSRPDLVAACIREIVSHAKADPEARS